MENYSFLNAGRTVSVRIDEDGDTYFMFTLNGARRVFLIKNFLFNFRTKQLEVEWAELIRDNQNSELNSTVAREAESTLAQYNALTGVTNLPVALGPYLLKLSMNQVMMKTLGVKCFNNSGTFVDPNV
jgi:hypothetical protein